MLNASKNEPFICLQSRLQLLHAFGSRLLLYVDGIICWPARSGIRRLIGQAECRYL